MVALREMGGKLAATLLLAFVVACVVQLTPVHMFSFAANSHSVIFGAATASAADYECSDVSLVAQVETDGTVHVTDQRIFRISDNRNEGEALRWLYNGFDSDAEITISHVRMAPVDEAGNVTGDWTVLAQTVFQLAWRDESATNGTETDTWAYDRYRHLLVAFAHDLPDRVIFEVTYEVEDAIQAYDDAAEFNWRYVSSDYLVPLKNVEAEVVLPVAAGAAVTPYENVFAWGHGPSDGLVDVRTDGTIVFTDPEVASTNYAEARVLFPVSWLTNLNVAAKLEHQGTLRYYDAENTEATWVDRDVSRDLINGTLTEVLLGLAALCLAVGLVLWVWLGRERLPRFRDQYWMEEPDPRLIPAVLGRLWRWNHESIQDLTATVLDMVRRGTLKMEKSETGALELLLLPNVADTLGQTVTPATPQTIPSRESDEGALDQATYKLFRTVTDGCNHVVFNELKKIARTHPRDFLVAYEAWQQTLTQCVAPYDFFDRKSRRVQRVVLITAAVLAVVAIVGFFTIDKLAACLVFVAAIALGVVGNYLMRRSAEGNDIAAYAKALRNWMRDGGWQREAGKLTSEEQSALIPYAVLFNMLEQVEDTPYEEMPPTKLTRDGTPLDEWGSRAKQSAESASSITPPAESADVDASELIQLAPKFARSFEEAFRIAYQRAEVS